MNNIKKILFGKSRIIKILGLKIAIDTFTLAYKNQVRIVINDKKAIDIKI